jgi:hypothetical protein
MPAHPLSGFARVAVIIATFALGCAASVGLWILWTGRCNEACASKTVVAMMVFLALLPTLGTLVAVLLVSMNWPARTKAAVGAALFAVAAGVAAWLGQLAVPGGGG